jgi:carboxyl-terminal processing protease
MRGVVLAAAILLMCSGVALAKTSPQPKPFDEVFGKTISDYVTEPSPADMVRGAVEGMIKFAPESPAGAFARTKLAGLSDNKTAALATFNTIFDKFKSSGSPQPDQTALLEAAIGGMLAALDPHSNYMNPVTFKEMQVQAKGTFGGVGLEVTIEDSLVKVVSPLDESPAARAGVLPGDLITAIDGAPVLGLSLAQAVSKMRGDVNSVVTLTIQHKGEAKPLDVKVVRDIIKINPVKARAEGDIGYVRITAFNEQTATKVTEAIVRLKQEIGQGLKGFVIDLRNDPGGLLDQVINVSDAFLDNGVIVMTKGRNPVDNKDYSAKPGDLAGGKKIVLLINGGSAAGSEIMAGALQDNHRATVMGSRSFGKGTVQTILPLGSGGALRLTTSRYLTPSGRSIQARGIDPDIAVEQPLPDDLKAKAAENAIGESNLPGHLKGGGEGSQSGSASYVPPDAKDDAQLQAAFNVMRGGAPVAEATTPAPETAPVVADAKPDAGPAAPSSTPSAASLGKRVALVIGNANYSDQAPLKNPPTDAKAIADALTALGFTDVKLLDNLSKQAMESALVDFADEANSADWAVVYYAGHGMEVEGENFLIPVDAQLKQENHIRLETVPLQEVLEAAQGAKKLRLVILDACRENPFVPKMSRTAASRSIGRGLARIEPSGGELVAYSARDGQVAADGDGANSPFVAALLEHIKDPGLDIRLMFARVRDKVLADTHNEQEPFTYGSLPGEMLTFAPTQ